MAHILIKKNDNDNNFISEFNYFFKNNFYIIYNIIFVKKNICQYQLDNNHTLLLLFYLAYYFVYHILNLYQIYFFMYFILD